MIRIAAIALALTLCASPALALDDRKFETLPVWNFAFPDFNPDFQYDFGIRAVDAGDALNRALKYTPDKENLFYGMDFLSLPLPNRIHLELDYVGHDDRFIDLSYAYGDALVLRYIDRTLYHNVGSYTLSGDDASTSTPSVQALDADGSYGLNVSIYDYWLRLKSPGFPAHLYVKARQVTYDGSIQSRYLGGSGGYNEIVRTSQQRQIDWESSEVEVGANSHLGHVEVEASRTEKRFDPYGDAVMSADYSTAYDYLGGLVRDAGPYPYGAYATLRGATNRVRLHTDYTNTLTASVTLTSAERTNETGGAESDYAEGAGRIVWRPRTDLSLGLDLRRQSYEPDNPSTLPAGYLGFSSYASSITGIRSSISYVRDTLSANMRYRPVSSTLVVVKATRVEVEREDYQEWDVPGSSSENTVSVMSVTRLSSSARVRVELKGSRTDEPAYETDPEDSLGIGASASFSPVPKLKAFAGARVCSESRGDVEVNDVTGYDRDVKRSKAYARLTWLAAENVTFSAAYAVFKNSIDQAMSLGTTTDGDAAYDEDAAYSMLSASWQPVDRLKLSGTYRLTTSKGSISTVEDGVEEAGEIDSVESDYTIEARYMLNRNWEIGGSLRHIDYDDRAGDEDGTASVVLLSARHYLH